MLRKISYIISFCFLASSIYAKDKPMAEEVSSINDMLNEIFIAKTDRDKLVLNQYVVELFFNYLKTEESYTADFDSVKYLTVLQSEDNKLRVYTWNLCFDDGSFKYFGYLQYKDKKEYLVYFLDDKKNVESEFERWYRSPSEWYGVLYYEIITTKFNSRNYYTLIGWDGADLLINRKVIEVLSFDRKGMPEFGKRAFRVDKLSTGRLTFEYADRATMLVRYNEKNKIIVLDHLSPPEQKYQGMYQYYGPDFSYDALIFRGGRWVYQSDIDPEKAINYKRNGHVNSLKRRGNSGDF